MYKVLIVEDEKKIREHLIGIIDWYNHECMLLKPCSNGIEGIESIILNNPDIVISDIEMPLLNGLEMFERAKEINFKKIILTSYSNFAYAKKGISLKIDEYLLKPIDVEELISVINKCMSELNYKKIPKLLKIDSLNNEAKIIYQYIINNYQEECRIKDITSALNYSESSFYKKFASYFKISYTEFLTLYRLQQALLLLLSSDLSISNVAFEVGFNDYKYFHKVFVKHLGISPSNYIKQNK